MATRRNTAKAVEPEAPAAIDWPLVRAILRQVEDALGFYLDTGADQSIDLRGVAHMTAATYQALKATLAAGEVSARVAADIRVEVQETQYPGVWWVTHFNERGAIVTELIEVTEIPAILRAHRTEMRGGRDRLRRAHAEPSSS